MHALRRASLPVRGPPGAYGAGAADPAPAPAGTGMAHALHSPVRTFMELAMRHVGLGVFLLIATTHLVGAATDARPAAEVPHAAGVVGRVHDARAVGSKTGMGMRMLRRIDIDRAVRVWKRAVPVFADAG